MHLLGQSWGSWLAIEYALAHPDDVAAIYGDNPVCDFRSWPGGRDGKRSDTDWERCKAAWGLSEEEATAMIVAGFIEPIVRELPMEYAVEMNRLIELNMAEAGAIG